MFECDVRGITNGYQSISDYYIEIRVALVICTAK